MTKVQAAALAADERAAARVLKRATSTTDLAARLGWDRHRAHLCVERMKYARMLDRVGSLRDAKWVLSAAR